MKRKFAPSGYYSFGPCGIISHRGYLAYTRFPNISDPDSAPLANHRVIYLENKEVMKSLVLGKGEAYKTRVSGFAAIKNNLEVVKLLLSEIDDKKYAIEGCLTWACRENNLATVKYLFAAAKEIPGFDPIGRFPFTNFWCFSGKHSTNRLLLNYGIIINYPERYELHSYSGNLQAAKQLILYGPDISGDLDGIIKNIRYELKKNKSAQESLNFFLMPAEKRMQAAKRFDRSLNTQSFIRGL